jgi:hypothetical protein
VASFELTPCARANATDVATANHPIPNAVIIRIKGTNNSSLSVPERASTDPELDATAVHAPSTLLDEVLVIK